MNTTEAIQWAKGVKMAGDPLDLSLTTEGSHSLQFDVLEPTTEQMSEFNYGQPLRMQEGDPINEIYMDGDKIILVVYF